MLGAQGLTLDAQRAALEGTMGLEQTNSDIYQAELQHQLGQRQADQNRSESIVGTALGAAGAIAGALSDVRSKENIMRAPGTEDFERSEPASSEGGGFSGFLKRFGAGMQKRPVLSDERTKTRIRSLREEYSALSR